MRNEPVFWAGSPSAEEYAALVKATVPAIRAADPGATILAGAISQIDLPYVERFLRTRPLAGVDAFSIHPYRDGRPEGVVSDYEKIRALLTRDAPAGQAPPPIVCSEWGYTTADGRNGEADQARYLVRMILTDLMAGVDLTVLYEWTDDGPDSANGEHRFGILRQDRTPKPAYPALADFLRRLRGYAFRHRIRSGRSTDYRLLFQGPGGLALVTWTSDETAPLAAQTPRVVSVGKDDPSYASLSRLAQARTSPDDRPDADVLPSVEGIVATSPPTRTARIALSEGDGEALVDPSFEAGGAGWGASPPEAGKSVGITDAVSRTGERALFMRAEPGTAPSWFGWSQTVAPVAPGERYAFVGWVRTTDTRGPAGWFVHVDGVEGALPLNRVLTTPNGSSDGQRIALTFTVPPGGTSVTIGTSLYGSGIAYFDDASLTKIAPTP